MERRGFVWDKLVRDKIPERIVAEGGDVDGDQLADQSYVDGLKDKLAEEAQELSSAFQTEDIISEIADIEEVLSCLKRSLGITDREVEQKRDEKNQKFGSFEQGQYIHRTRIPIDSDYLEHLLAHPGQYREIKKF